MKRALLLSLSLCACGETFLPETVVNDLRVLGVQAEPAEVRPGESASLSALIVDPTRAEAPTILWLGCDPDPFNLGRSACSDPAVLQDFGALLAPGGALPSGIHVIGFGPQATYSVAKDLFAQLPEGDSRREVGTVGQVLVFAVAETVAPDQLGELFKRVQTGEVKARIALFRIVVRETSGARNTNPVPTRFLFARVPLPLGARALVHPGESLPVSLEATGASFEPYVQTSPDGTVEDKVERLISAWYSSSGRFTQPRLALDSEVVNVFTAPGGDNEKDPRPVDREGRFYMVLRDARGGNAWTQARFFVCDDTAPYPRVTAVNSPATRDGIVSLEGEHLDQLVDVVAGDVALEQGALNSATGRWEARIPAALPAGSSGLELRASNCSRTPGPGPLVVPSP